MLSKTANFYYKQYLRKYPNSYFAEDDNKIIIGIDCEYLDANEMDFSLLKMRFYEEAAKKRTCKNAGFFGVLSADFVSLFENLEQNPKKNYEFPLFLFANARAYLIYEKQSKMYFEYGEKGYFDFLREDFKEDKQKNLYFEILNDENEEKAYYTQIVAKAKEYLLSGDVFQIVLSSQICVKHNVNSFEFYELLAAENKSPYMFYFPSKYGVVLGSSPELVLSIKNKEIFIAPIAGTRNLQPNSDINALKEDLLSDEKELCEHRMLVDLARNDISVYGSDVRVERVFEVITYKFVMHLVSSVYANLRGSIFDAIGAIFPAGTLSGAPKIRALELINELEKCNRGVYGGAIGFLNFNEDVCLAILIRSAFFKDDKAYIASGAGIVLKSVPEKEYAEIKAKRQSLLYTFEKLIEYQKS